MSGLSGFSNQKKLGKSEFVTVQGAGSDKKGINTAQMYLADLTGSALPISAVTQSNDRKVVYLDFGAAHGARVGDVLRMTTGTLLQWEFDVIEVQSANIVGIWNISPTLPLATEEAKLCRWVTAKADGEGALTVSSGPVQFTRNGATQTVIQDTATPANNRPLPAGLYIVKDGQVHPVTKDTVTAANTLGIPVEIVASSGTPINITAGDLNVQLSDAGVNFDATRIGDGSGVYLDINPDGSINVLGPLTDAQLRASPVPVSMASVPLPTGAATEAKQDTQITELQDIEADVEALSAKFGTLGQKTMAGSAPVVIASDQSAIPVTGTFFQATQPISAAALPLPTGAATEAKQDSQITELQDIEADVEAMSAKLPATLGQKTAANSMSVVLASDQGAVPVAQAALTGSYQEDLTVTDAGAETLTAPAGAKWVILQADDTNTGNMRVKIGAAATTTSGMQLQPGRDMKLDCGGDVSYIMEAGFTGKLYAQFGA